MSFLLSSFSLPKRAKRKEEGMEGSKDGGKEARDAPSPAASLSASFAFLPYAHRRTTKRARDDSRSGTAKNRDRMSLDAQTTFADFDVLSLATNPEKVWSALYDTSAEAAFRYDGAAAGPLPRRMEACFIILRAWQGNARFYAVERLVLC